MNVIALLIKMFDAKRQCYGLIITLTWSTAARTWEDVIAPIVEEGLILSVPGEGVAGWKPRCVCLLH